VSKLRVGLVGAGSIAQFHVQSYAKNPDVEIVGVADLKLDRAQAMAAAYGIPDTFGNHHDLLAMEGLDAISVCTWNNSHAEISIDALNAGKDVLCEKPLSRTVAEALDVQKAVGATGRVLEVGYVRRYGLNTQILKKFVDSGDLGDIYYSKASSIRRMGNPGGWFADVGAVRRRPADRHRRARHRPGLVPDGVAQAGQREREQLPLPGQPGERHRQVAIRGVGLRPDPEHRRGHGERRDPVRRTARLC